jgi:alkanesulfonate monooxygenase SsuD/methylene tetrahydromethanopterin reductase-like flavin-dependent oxidoreductase (luciferase family)
VTRHPAVTASAIATLQIESGGRAALVLGRGDSAVLQLGIRPATTRQLERAVDDIQRFLRGDDVSTVDGQSARTAWIGAFAPAEVPVSVAATGPATIALAASTAGRVDLTVGADPERIACAVAEARRAGPDGAPSVGAFVNVVVHPDVAVARDLVRGSAAIFAHFVGEGPRERAVRAGPGGRGGARQGLRGGGPRAPHGAPRGRPPRRVPRPLHRRRPGGPLRRAAARAGRARPRPADRGARVPRRRPRSWWPRRTGAWPRTSSRGCGADAPYGSPILSNASTTRSQNRT